MRGPRSSGVPETRATNPVLVVDPPLPAVPRRPRAVKDGDFRYIFGEGMIGLAVRDTWAIVTE